MSSDEKPAKKATKRTRKPAAKKAAKKTTTRRRATKTTKSASVEATAANDEFGADLGVETAPAPVRRRRKKVAEPTPDSDERSGDEKPDQSEPRGAASESTDNASASENSDDAESRVNDGGRSRSAERRNDGGRSRDSRRGRNSAQDDDSRGRGRGRRGRRGRRQRDMPAFDDVEDEFADYEADSGRPPLNLGDLQKLAMADVHRAAVAEGLDDFGGLKKQT